MRLDGYRSAITESSHALKTGAADKTSSPTSGLSVQRAATEDTTHLSFGAASVQTLTQAAFDTTSRAAKIASLQQAVRSGEYSVEPATIASALAKTDV